LQAQKLRNEKLGKELEAAATSQADLAKAHDLLHHAREEAHKDVAMAISAAEVKLRDAALKLIVDHEAVGAASMSKLQAGIQICEAEGHCDPETVRQAWITLRREQDFARKRAEISECREKGDMDCLGGKLRGAIATMGSNHSQVREAVDHLKTKTSEQIKEVAAKTLGGGFGFGVNGSVAVEGAPDFQEARRRLLRAEEYGLPQTETAPIREYLRREELARATKAAAAQINMTSNGLEALIELETSGQHLEFMTDQERAFFRATLTGKVTALLPSLPSMTVGHAADVLEFAARGTTDLDDAEMEKHLNTFKARLTSELESAQPNVTGHQHLEQAIRAAQAMDRAMRVWPSVRDEAFADALASAMQREERWVQRVQTLKVMDSYTEHGNLIGYREMLMKSKRSNFLLPADVDNFERNLKDLEAKAAAHKAKVEAATAEVTKAPSPESVAALRAALEESNKSGLGHDHPQTLAAAQAALDAARQKMNAPAAKAAEL